MLLYSVLTSPFKEGGPPSLKFGLKHFFLKVESFLPCSNTFLVNRLGKTDTVHGVLSTCKKSIARKYSAYWESHLQQLEVQSKLLDFLPLGSEDHLWQRLLLGMPEGHLSFILRASCDCLPSPSSLARWGYLPIRKCPLCSYPHCKAQHILSSCSVSLSEGRYTYRHDLVLAELIPFLQ